MPAGVRDACDPTTGPGGNLINFNSLSILLYNKNGTNDWRVLVVGNVQSSASYDQEPVWRSTWITQVAAPDCTTIESVSCAYACNTGVTPSAEAYDFTGSTAVVSVL
jgi:hypothetical protein